MEKPSSSSSTSSDHLSKEFDVFVSFKGNDVRHTFVGFLYDALHRSGIKVFNDEKELQIGDNISDSILQVIERSKCSIVVFLEVYASSRWCLRELTKIVDTRETTHHHVLPVFYHVDPRDVRNQSGIFEKSFEEHKAREVHSNEIQTWKNAMKKISQFSGVVIKDSPEVEIVETIVDQIKAWCPTLV